MKKLLCICIILSSFSSINCQTDAQYSHNMFNHMTINPGYAGSNDMVGINMLNRNQFLGMKDIAPRYTVFSVNMPFTLLEKDHGVGLVVQNDQNPVINDIGVKLAYAYRLKMKIGDGRLGIGGSFGFLNSDFNFQKVKFDQGNDPMFGTVNGESKKPTIFDLGLGVFYKSEKLYMGISATHLVNGEYKVNNVALQDFPRSGYFVTAGYVIPLSNPMFELLPSFFVQSDGASTTVNLNTNLMYNNRIWGGLSYRAGTAFTALFGIELLAGVKVGVAYDYETTAISKVANGNLEVAVIYNFKLKKEKIPQKYKSIRFL